ncbi:hypothetical protein, variant 1 [Aphanomyces astaci]|uniref:WW domain-containing protein n=1 Tax=Aphanomyces astaci TaxID=112090 RepID=W4FVI1_APHAT|nr:hypothetical protein, variant 1 [Aphanomyces astaci]ETV70961.1 hypothetical protein, variant 1 [Aphanomyces astaci]|eukprot:XP_009839627.1 hypothetical protein, variant 1 [Aphanomyces astaci]
MQFVDVRTEWDAVDADLAGSPSPHKRQQHSRWREQSIVPGKVLHSNDTRTLDQRRRRRHRPRMAQTTTMVRHEPIDYLALRRTELSKRALMRMRDVVVQEILAPTASLEPRPLDKSTTILPLPSQMSFTPAAPIVWQPTANTVEASHAAQLHRDMQQLHAAQSCASAAVATEEAKVREALADVRNAVASMYTFTPTFRIWSRFKTLSAIERWQRFVTWHREEAARLKALTHFGVRIQRAFRRRRGRLAGFIDRAALRHAEWTSAIRVQSWMRRLLATHETHRLRESKVATLLQKIWRGRVGRATVKHMLRERLRTRLRYLSPTGSLHRLRDVAMYRGDMRRTLERMLTLVEDVHVSFRRNPSPDKQDQQDMPDDLHMSSKAVSIPAWYTAIADLNALIAARHMEIDQAKRQYEAHRALRAAAARSQDTADKAHALADAIARVHRANELIAMYREDCESIEWVRSQRVAEVDCVHRAAIRDKRSEKDACMAMHMQELQTRHYISEHRWREADRRRRRGEVDKLEAMRHMEADAAAARRQEYVNTMIRQQELRVQMETDQKHQRVQAWQLKTKEELVGLFERMEARKIENDRVKAERKELKRARQQQARDRAAALELTRIARLMELDRQHDERLAIEAEDRLMRALLSQQKKADEAKVWDAMRIEANKARPDPLALPPDVLAARQAVERERHAQLSMAEEESRTRVYVDAMAKATFLHQCKLRKRQVELDHKAEAKARMAMEREELDEITRLRKIANKIAYNQTLKRMQAADEAYRAKQAEKLFEARCRKLMHNEEMRLHRLYTEVLHRERLRERKERHLMHNEDMYMQRILDEREKLRLRTMEKTHRVEMAVEDVRSHQWQSLEAQATSMGLAIWSARELKTLAAHVQHFPNMLRANIVLMSSIMGQKRDPPWKGVRWTLSDDPTPANEVAKSHARDMWSRIRHKYAKRTVAATEAKAGADALYAGDLPQALRWLRMAFRDGYKGPTLLRNIAKCYVKLYEAHLHDNDLSTGWSWYVKACEHLALQASPSFLDEMARALYLLCRFQHAAEILARIIYSFPTYVRMPTVIFRAAMLMWHLGLYEQSTDYLLHLLESPPAPWTDLDLMFLIARLYLLDENKAHATFAYDDAFRRYRVHGFHFQYPSWKAWVGDAAVWRHFGAKALAANEYLVAKDLYQQVIKRRHDEVQVEHRQEERDLDWFHLAQCQIMLHEYVPAGQTVAHWLEAVPYADRVMARCKAWPREKWTSMGVVVPAWEQQDSTGVVPKRATATPPLKRKRKPLAKARKKRMRRPRVKYTSTAELRQWVQIDDTNTGKTFYFNEKTFDVSWTRPT